MQQLGSTGTVLAQKLQQNVNFHAQIVLNLVRMMLISPFPWTMAKYKIVHGLQRIR